MFADADIAAVGALLGDQARASMLNALLAGAPANAGELARVAGVSRSGASAHLRKLRDGGLVTEEIAGRMHLFRLANAEVAEALEALAHIAPARSVSGLRQSEAARALRRARTCYDHLAGELGVAVTDALLGRRLLRRVDGSFALTPSGAAWFGELGVDVAAARAGRRAFARACPDWSERRVHLAGALGAALADAVFVHGWVRRLPGGRAIAVTHGGEEWLRRELGLDGLEKWAERSPK